MVDKYEHRGLGKVRILSPGQMAEQVGWTLEDDTRDHSTLNAWWCPKCNAAHIGHGAA